MQPPEPASPSPVRPLPYLVAARPRAARPALAALAALLLALPACRGAAPAFGDTPQEARANSDAFFGAVAARFTNVQRTPKFAAARGKLGRYALSPSQLMGDTSVWTGTGTGAARTLVLAGRTVGGRYLFDATAQAPVPVRPGDSRHVMRLRQLGDEQYEWLTTVDMALGGAAPGELVDVWRALLATAARTPDALLRAEYRAAVPRATRVMGQLATLDTLKVRPAGDGSAFVTLSTTLHPERLERRYPHFARYLRKYVEPARYAFTFSDRRGARWVVMTARDNRLTFRLRASADGRLAPLEGAVRPLPDTLLMRGELFAKFSVFTVGMTDLEAVAAVVDTPRERALDFRFQKEPDWHFPLAVNHLISAALRRPFAGEGAQLRLALQERADGQTVLARRVQVQVQEGAIVRWLGRLGSGAMDDFSGRAEEEESRFTVELFQALQADFAALLAVAAAGGGA